MVESGVSDVVILMVEVAWVGVGIEVSAVLEVS
jgi:hypothetical protein